VVISRLVAVLAAAAEDVIGGRFCAKPKAKDFHANVLKSDRTS
jgi:hypothetical protein